MSKTTLKALAVKALKENPDTEKVYVTEDGQVFISENYANLHAKQNATGKKQALYDYNRSEILAEIEVATSDPATPKEKTPATAKKATAKKATNPVAPKPAVKLTKDGKNNDK